MLKCFLSCLPERILTGDYRFCSYTNYRHMYLPWPLPHLHHLPQSPPSASSFLYFCLFFSPPTKLWTKMQVTIGKIDWMSTRLLTCRACQESGNVFFFLSFFPLSSLAATRKGNNSGKERTSETKNWPPKSFWREVKNWCPPPTPLPHPSLDSGSGLLANTSLWPLCR